MPRFIIVDGLEGPIVLNVESVVSVVPVDDDDWSRVNCEDTLTWVVQHSVREMLTLLKG